MPKRKQSTKKNFGSREGNKEDEQLVRSAQYDTQEYGVLYEKYADRIYTYIWKRLGGQRDAAEDLTQETFLRGFQGLSRFRTRGYSYLTYLLRISHNLLVNRYRKRKDVSLDAYQEPLELVALEEEIDKKARLGKLQEGIRKMPKHEQDILRLYYQEEYSLKEIAQKLGKSENAAKLLLSRARKRLRGILEQN